MTAGEQYNFFCFNGLKSDNNHRLHITSHRYDEEHALRLVRKSTTVIAIHGCKEREPLIYAAGLDLPLISNQAGPGTEDDTNSPPLPHFTGKNSRNICNRSRTGKGVQLEISRAFRDSPESWSTIAEAVQDAMHASLRL